MSALKAFTITAGPPGQIKNKKKLGRFKRRRVWLLVLFPLGCILSLISAVSPQATERFYSRGFYRVISGLIGRMTSIVPVSLAEILLYIGILLTIFLAFRGVKGVIKAKGKRLARTGLLLLNILCAASAVYFAFVVSCAPNYNRLTFAEQSGLDVRPSGSGELKELCLYLVSSISETREKLEEDASGLPVSGFSGNYEMAEAVSQTYGGISGLYPALGGYVPKPKPVLTSVIMSYLDITGIYFPFTFESNVNTDILDFNIPVTMAHELSHFKGFMREQEANYIAYLACVNSGNDFFEYSGLYLAMIHSTNALYSADRDAYWEVMGGLSEAVRRDMASNSAYWSRFETPASNVATAVNNTYLRANGQQSGVKSYGEMVDLLLAGRRASKSQDSPD